MHFEEKKKEERGGRETINAISLGQQSLSSMVRSAVVIDLLVKDLKDKRGSGEHGNVRFSSVYSPHKERRDGGDCLQLI